MAKKTAAESKKPATKKGTINKSKKKAPAQRKRPAEPSLSVLGGMQFRIIGLELCHRLEAVARRRTMSFEDVVQEAVQKYLEGELIDPTTPEKDDALYPATDKPLEEVMVVRSNEPSDDQVHERATLPGEVTPDDGTTH